MSSAVTLGPDDDHHAPSEPSYGDDPLLAVSQAVVYQVQGDAFEARLSVRVPLSFEYLQCGIGERHGDRATRFRLVGVNPCHATRQVDVCPVEAGHVAAP